MSNTDSLAFDAQPEALLLFPMEMAPTLQLGIDVITTSLYRQTALSTSVPYKWSFIDQPKGGSRILMQYPVY
jgi:hypothetical protein